MTAPVSDEPTGAELVEAIRAAAAAEGVPLLDFVRRMVKAPTSYLLQLAEAERPTPRTVSRVRALIAGAEIPRARRYDVSMAPEVRVSPVPPTLPVDRDPCFRCGVRGDLGCAHRPASRPVDPFRFARAAA